MSRGRSDVNGPKLPTGMGWMVGFNRACERFLESRGEKTLTRAEVLERGFQASKRERGRQGQKRKDRADQIADELEKSWRV